MNSNMTAFTPANSTKVVYNLSFTKWILFEAFSVLMMILASYVLVVLIRYQGSKRKSICKTPSTSVDCETANSSSNGSIRLSGINSHNLTKKQKVRKTKTSANSVRILCLCASFFAVIRISADQMELGTYGRERVDCRIYQTVVVVAYAISATFIYSALWMRLRIFFAHPIIQHLVSSTIVCLLWFALFCILGSALLNTIIFITSVQIKDSNEGCDLGETMFIPPNIRYVILTISTVVSQGLLLFLLLYPLLKHRSKNKSQTACHHPSFVTFASTGMAQKRNLRDTKLMDTFSSNTSQSNIQQSKKLRREKKLVAIIFRVLITAIVCVISDVIAAVISTTLDKQPRVVSNLAFNFNLLVNLLCVLLSFGDWKERLVPCCHEDPNPNSKKPGSTLIMKTLPNKFFGSLPSAPAKGKVYISGNLCSIEDTCYAKEDTSV